MMPLPRILPVSTIITSPRTSVQGPASWTAHHLTTGVQVTTTTVSPSAAHALTNMRHQVAKEGFAGFNVSGSLRPAEGPRR